MVHMRVNLTEQENSKLRSYMILRNLRNKELAIKRLIKEKEIKIVERR